MTGNIISFFWGFAEATLFFIVPDVGLSIIALQGVPDGMVACLYALAGAMAGGAIMFYWGQANIEKVTEVLHTIPAIRIKDTQKVMSDLKTSGILAMLFGPISGIPYKIYASYAHQVTDIVFFLLVSIPARIVRFVLVTFAAPYIINKILPDVSFTLQTQAMLAIWALLYAAYFFIKRK